ncbi:alpha-mannosidase [Tardisphaera saccharovorans]
MQRNSQEIDTRLLAIFAASVIDERELSWEKSGDARYALSVDGTPKNPKTTSILLVKGYAGSALVTLNGHPYYSLDGYHNYIPLSAGDNRVEAIFSPYRAFGETVSIDPGIPYRVEIAEDPYRLYLYLSALNDLLSSIQDDDLKADVGALISEALRIAYFDGVGVDQVVIASVILRRDVISQLSSMKTNVDLSAIGYKKSGDLTRYGEALSFVINNLAQLRAKYGKRGELAAIAHAHIDTAWLWPFDETRRKVARTLSTMLTLMDNYDFVYMQSMALYYQWIKEDYPELYDRIKAKIKQGKWIVGAGWVESDANMLSGESFARQFLYSQRFYLREFGRLADIFWLPDTFGFSGSIPQIAKLGGVKYFATHKVFWNDTDKFPYSYFNWVGIDGTAITAMTFGNGRGGYNSTFDIREVVEQWHNNSDKSKPLIYSYGYGDGGGGPTPEMLIKSDIVNELPLLPKVHKGPMDFGSPSESWRGELYLETHRGTLTSHSMMKYLHAKAEAALREAELWAALAGKKANFEELWKTLLKDEFHDVLPGSAIRSVYEQVYQELGSVIEKANAIAEESKSLLAGKGDGYLVFNSLNWDREDYVEVGGKVEGQAQLVADGKYLVKVRAPTVGFSPLQPLEPKGHVSVIEDANTVTIENPLIRVIISKEDGTFSVFDKEAGRTTVTKGNVFKFYENMPGWADAWDIEPSYQLTSFSPKLQEVKVLEGGPLRAKASLRFGFRSSSIEEKVAVSADSKIIDLSVKPLMRDRELLLKVWFTADVNAERATSEIPFGNVERPTTKNTSWEKAKFEVPMLRWTDISDGGYGMAIVAEAKHGIAAEGSSLGLSISKTPMYPDPLTDVEDVETRVWVVPHVGTWKDAKVHRLGYEILYPLTLVKGELRSKSFISLSDEGLILEAVKSAEDGNGIVLRIYDAFNRKGRANLITSSDLKWNDVQSVDLLELNQVDAKVKKSASSVEFNYPNFGIITLLLK